MKKVEEPNAFVESFKNKRLYILTAILSFIGIGVPFLIYGISILSDKMAAFEYPLLMWAFVFIYLLIGWVTGNSVTNKWRKKEAQYDGQVPYDVKQKAWEYRMYFFLPAAIVLTVCLGLEVYALITGGYPLLDYDYSRPTINATSSMNN